MLHGVNDMIWFGKINLVIVSYNLPLWLGLKTHFYNVSWFVVKKTMWITQPGNCSEEDTKNKNKDKISVSLENNTKL